jgi:hypothetical protein
MDADFEASRLNDFAAIVAKRPAVAVMNFADYNHDGWKSEFYLQTEAGPCGHRGGIVIGITKQNQRLHAFGTASNPDKPLVLRYFVWEALRDASGPVEVVEWACGDHGLDSQFTLQLRWTAKGIEGTRRSFACTADGSPGQLIGEGPL